MIDNNYDSYDYYLESLYKIPNNYKLNNNGLFLETDLNIYVQKSKDIYLAYKLYNKLFCELGYKFVDKCRKIMKKCYN